MPSQRQLEYTKQLEDFRKLSEEVMHDINNLLSGILGYSDLLLMDPALAHWRAPIEDISNAGKRISSLSRLLSAFGDKYGYLPQILDLNDAILGIEGILSRILGKEIGFIATNTPKLWPVKADLAKMKQALITLAVDMKGTLPEGGTIRISAKNSTVEPASLPGSRLEPGHYVIITAISSGNIAVDEASASLRNIASPLDSIADAEMTSRLPGVCDIIKMTGGKLVIDRCSGQELRVSIYLPAINFEPSLRKPEDDTFQPTIT
jgi:two-component system cell cycle sensor histidine kinase/response regulator CckA